MAGAGEYSGGGSLGYPGGEPAGVYAGGAGSPEVPAYPEDPLFPGGPG